MDWRGGSVVRALATLALYSSSVPSTGTKRIYPWVHSAGREHVVRLSNPTETVIPPVGCPGQAVPHLHELKLPLSTSHHWGCREDSLPSLCGVGASQGIRLPSRTFQTPLLSCLVVLLVVVVVFGSGVKCSGNL